MSNVKVGQTSYPVKKRKGKMEGREGSEGQVTKGGEGTTKLEREGGVLKYLCRSLPPPSCYNYATTAYLARAGLKSQSAPDCRGRCVHGNCCLSNCIVSPPMV